MMLVAGTDAFWPLILLILCRSQSPSPATARPMNKLTITATVIDIRHLRGLNCKPPHDRPMELSGQRLPTLDADMVREGFAWHVRHEVPIDYGRRPGGEPSWPSARRVCRTSAPTVGFGSGDDHPGPGTTNLTTPLSAPRRP